MAHFCSLLSIVVCSLGKSCLLFRVKLQDNVELTDSNIQVEITLGMLAKAMKGKIEEQVNKAFDRALA